MEQPPRSPRACDIALITISRLATDGPTAALSTEGSVIPGETEEDGLLRREYVLVGDTQCYLNLIRQ